MNFLRVRGFQLLVCKDNISQFLIRTFHLEAVEETISVPWGVIAGKRWGNQPGQPILALHGLFDNAASFDKLVPLLKLRQPILAIDIPGFGKSSNPPPGLSPHFLEIIVWLRYLIKYIFRWEKVTFLSHSFGSNLAFTYSGIFPNEVDKYVSIDCAKINMAAREQFILDDFRKAYDGQTLKKLQIQSEGTYEEFLISMIESREKAKLPLSEDMCKILLTRELEKISEKYYKSNNDRRIYLKYIGRTTLPFLEALSKRIKCEVLAIRATQGVINAERTEIYEKHIANMKINSPRVLTMIVEGRHHVHMEKPEEVAMAINNFLN